MPLYSRPLRLKNTVKEGERKEGEGGPLKVVRAGPQVAVDILLSLGALTCSRGVFLKVGLAGDGRSGMTSSLLSLLLVPESGGGDTVGVSRLWISNYGGADTNTQNIDPYYRGLAHP